MHLPNAPFTAQPMKPAHLTAVMAIERQSFALPWPASAYQHEITHNEMAHYYVLCQREWECLSPAAARPASAWQCLRSSIWRPATPREEVVLGYGGFWMMADEAHISTLATRPDVRGRGLGALLMLSLLDEARRLEAALVTLEVRVSNAAARALYTKYGFEPVGRRKNYYQDNGEDAMIMTTPPLASDRYWQMVDVQRAAALARLTAGPKIPLPNGRGTGPAPPVAPGLSVPTGPSVPRA